MKLSSLSALEIVILTTFSGASMTTSNGSSEENSFKMTTFLYHWSGDVMTRWNMQALQKNLFLNTAYYNAILHEVHMEKYMV